MKPQDDNQVTSDNQKERTDEKKQWQKPRLEFIEPELHKRGNVKDVTGQGFFGAFSP